MREAVLCRAMLLGAGGETRVSEIWEGMRIGMGMGMGVYTV